MNLFSQTRALRDISEYLCFRVEAKGFSTLSQQKKIAIEYILEQIRITL